MDIARVIDRLVPNAKYNDASSYEALMRTWFDDVEVPELGDIESTWATLLQEDADARMQAQQEVVIKKEAKEGVRNIPQWATMSEQEAINFINTQVTDLASAKVVLRSMAIILVHLRDATWPNL